MSLSRVFQAAVLGSIRAQGRTLAPTEDWTPAALLWVPPVTIRRLQIPQEFLASSEAKEFFLCQILPPTVQTFKAQQVALVLPSWMSVCPADRNLGPVMRPSQDPDRQEILAVSFASQGEQELLILDVLRSPDRHPRLRLSKTLRSGSDGVLGGLVGEGLKASFQHA